MPHNNPATTDILNRNISALNSHDIEAYLANQHPEVEFVLPDGTVLRGREQARQYAEAFLQAFPDGQLSFGQQVLEPDGAATEVIFTGTNTGPLPTPGGMLPPTGRKVRLHSASILKIRDGLIASEHVYSGQPDLMTQLRITAPAPDEGA
jgi:predicted ester cyclase